MKNARRDFQGHAGTRGFILVLVWMVLPSLLAAEEPSSAAGGVRLTIANPLPFERTGEAVICGVPLPKGFARSSEGRPRDVPRLRNRE